MKLLLIATLLMSVTAYADQKTENFATLKAAISANIDQRINQIQIHKSCVQAATDMEQLKACKHANKEAMKKLHMENKGERDSWKAGKASRRESRKTEKTTSTKTN